MAAPNEIELLVKVATQQAVASVNGMAKSVEGSMATVNKAIKAGFAFLVGREIVQGFNAIVKSASEAEEAMTSLKVSLKLAGDFSEGAVAGFEALADELQRTTTLSDEQALAGVAMAKSFGASNAQAEKLVRAAADLAAVRPDIGFEGSVRALGQSLDGTAGRLSETIPQLKGFTVAQLKAGAAIDVVADRMGGAARAAGQTYAGSVIRAKNAFDNVLETLGEFVTKNTLVQKALEQAVEFFGRLQRVIKANEKAILELVRAGVVGMAKFAGGLIQAFSFADTVLVTVLDSFSALFRFLTNLPRIVKTAGDSVKSFSLGPLKALNEELNKETAEREAQSAKNLKSRKELYEGMSKSLKGFATELEKTNAMRLKSDKDASDSLKNQKKLQQEMLDLEIKRKKEAALTAATKDPFRALAGGIDDLDLSSVASKNQAVALGFGDALLKGAEGAASLLKSGVSSAVNAFLPGFGDAAGSIISELAKGPEHVRNMVRGFIESLPVMVENIIQSIPVLIEELVKALPRIATSFASYMPIVATRMSVELVKNIPNIVAGFAREMLKIPAKIIEELIKGLKDIFGFLNPFDGGGNKSFGQSAADSGIGSVIGSVVGGPVGSVVGAIGGWLGLQEDRNPINIPGNSARSASVAGGEMAGGGATSGGGTQNLTLVIKVAENELARTMVQLNNRGFRLA